MGYKDITAGNKTGRAKAARFIKSKGGTLGFEVSFEFKEGNSQERLSWVGWLTEKSLENTMETLVDVLGYNGSEVANAEGLLTDPKVLDYARDVQLVIEMEARKDESGNPKLDDAGQAILDPRIKWVNKVGGSAYVGLAPETAKNELLQIGFKAAFLKAKQSSAPPPNRIPNMAPGAPKLPDEKLPF